MKIVPYTIRIRDLVAGYRNDEEKFCWRVERDVQGHTNVTSQVQGANGP